MITPTHPGIPWDTDPIRGRVEHDCVQSHGYPMCMGSAARGEENCTCRSLPSTQHEAAERDAWIAHKSRNGKMCHGCFFRSRDPENAHRQRELVALTGPVYCHHGMPVFGVAGQMQRDCFAPRDERTYPVCVGWKKRRAPTPEPFFHSPLEIIK